MSDGEVTLRDASIEDIYHEISRRFQFVMLLLGGNDENAKWKERRFMKPGPVTLVGCKSIFREAQETLREEWPR